jgi:twitching motility protein PilT
MESLLFEILDPAQKKIITDDLDLDFAYAYEDREGASDARRPGDPPNRGRAVHTKARFRANYFHKTTGLAAVFRIIPTRVLGLDELGAPEVLRTLSDRRAGLVLVTGPTGSGKSTTLAAMIDRINRTRACHILTIEDPIEFVHEPVKAQITHREIGPHAPSFATAMKSAGREDPDVILVGELRTNETMKLALQLASFGVLVFATVHTNSAASTIERIINAFPADEQPQIRGMLAESLSGIVAQQLLKTADGKGRVAAHEILVGTPAIASQIREGKTFQIPSLIQAGQNVGMQSMDMALERLVAAGTITAEAAIEKALDKEHFAKKLA